MKYFIGLFVVTLLALNGVLSLPAGNPSDDAEVIGYPRRVSTRTDDDDDFKDFKGVIDTGSGYPFFQPNPSVLHFGFFDSFDDIFRRFSARLFPTTLLGGAGEGDSDESSGSGGVVTTSFDPKKGNTTSTVKVVDGHKVEVNETVYGDEHSVFKVRVVNVRPLEEGETVEETVQTAGDSSNTKPVTSSPEKAADSDEEEDGRREPLEKKPHDNEIERNIDDPEHSTATENIVEATTTTTTLTSLNEDNNPTTTMLPTNAEGEIDFITENSLEQAENSDDIDNNNGNGNKEFETNMSSSSSLSESNNVDDFDAAIESATDLAAAIENNEDPEVEDEETVNDNLNESSNNEDADVEDIDGDVESSNTSELSDNEDAAVNKPTKLAALHHNKYREDVSSSDDEGPDDVPAMPSTFNDEWGSYNEEKIDINRENNDLNNDIDVYDVEPFDLSNDIAVNDAPNLPLNPDAEFIDVYGAKQNFASMPKFEKLSLNQMTKSDYDDDDDDEERVEHLSSFSGEMK
ncbi:virus-induced RNA 1 [Haematobia irritans]|uniref:virus-induced RNA 1 n=1 Tax=Haematobia irritans TaxID=7368 RepID=UPI003F50BE54